MSSWTSGYVSDISYTHGFYRELTPAILGLVSLACNRRFPIRGRLSYCELGCGQGFSTNLLAAANPHIDFCATDFNPTHIVGAKALAEEAGIPNVHFFDDTFAEFLERPQLPAFDIISLHGVYSWISAENRRVIVEFIRRKLNPGGLVYISYNALPGWAAAMPLRRLLADHAGTMVGPIAPRIEAALQYVGKMKDANASFFRTTPGMSERFDHIKEQNRSYLAHEYFNRDWTPFYHSDVVADLSDAKLSYLGSAALLEQVDAINLTADQQKVLTETADPALRETARDYMINQQFRRDVFARGAIQLNSSEAQALWLDLRFALSTSRVDVPLKVQGVLGEASLQPDIYEPILDILTRGPATVRQLLDDRRISRLRWPQIRQALIVLAGVDHLQPALDAEGDVRRTERTRAFNVAVMDRARISNELQYLASPVTGGGIPVDRFMQLFLLAEKERHSDPVQFAWSALERQGQHLLKDGKPMERADDNITELRRRYETFKTRQRLVLEQVGIA